MSEPSMIVIALTLSVLGGVAVAGYFIRFEMGLAELAVVMLFSAVCGAGFSFLLAKSLSTWLLLLVPAGFLVGALMHAIVRPPEIPYSPGLGYKLRRFRETTLAPTAVGLGVALAMALAQLVISAESRYGGSPAEPEPGSSRDLPDGPKIGDRGKPPDTRAGAVSFDSKTIELSLNGNVGMLVNLIDGSAGSAFPVVLDAAAIAKEAASKFTSSLASKSGENLSDLLFEWLKRETSYERSRSLPPPSDRARAAPAFHVIRFEHGSADMPASGLSLAADIARFHRNSATLVFLVGSADRSGGEARNAQLSLERANTVARILMLDGISPLRLYPLVRPKPLPVRTPDGVREPENRRVEVLIR